MNNYFKIVSATVILFFSVFMSAAQKKDDVIMKAMQDELSRCMNGLKYKEYAKPFFIGFNVTDSKSLTIISTFGALIHSSESPQKIRSVRVLAGDYDFNDESLDNDITSPPILSDIDMPDDDDYYGIRRSLWSSTENVYINASRHFQRNKMNLAEQKKPLEEIPHRSFAKTEKVNLVIDSSEIKYDKIKLENYYRELSAVFNKYEDLSGSNVIFNFSGGNNYFVNSEGTRTKTPFRLAFLGLSAGAKTADGDNLQGQLSYYASDPSQLPPADNLKKDISEMVKTLFAKRNAPVFNEDYTGPVLIERKALAELISNILFSYDEGLIVNNNINTGYGMQYDQGVSPDLKIGKTIVSEMMTVKALPKLKTFKGSPLLGSFDADNEGVIPPDELTLIEKGKLRNLLNDRTITKPGQTPNGHGQGPGVISISFDNAVAKGELKNMLIKEAKSEAQEYAFILKSVTESSYGQGDFPGGAEDDFSSLQLDLYRVSLADGSEELVRSANLKSVSMKIFKKIIAASNETFVEHTVHTGAGGQHALSLILPGAILFKELEISGSETPFHKENIFVESPLKKNTAK